ncbi:hypothetical protein IRZ83_05590 [Flavobacterium sp. JLP]|uniref:hypothetical protein n=1 Tax=Flavobacterium sp. JLP TaxID=2783793 RepID=UPI00188B6E8F|nr:hypothetical protein [Flavobacterium sp. JLP]MBF4506135.1 hypothetical protein [Flavobacterium sp. JLP]
MKLTYILFAVLLLWSCNKKTESASEEIIPKDTVIAPTTKTQESIEGIYKTYSDSNNSEECGISLEINKTKDGYSYFLKTKTRQLKGKANFTKSESGEKYLVLEGIKWDEYEGDISHEEDSLSESEPKELEIPVGIDASYVKDTLTIQNYGNAMNSYTKLSECGSKYIQLIKKGKSNK